MMNKGKVVYAFIDAQNLHLGTSKDIRKGNKLVYRGWRLDFKRFRKYLSDKFRVRKAFIFIGKVRGNEKLYQSLKFYGYELVFKPTIKDNHGKAKGNVDAELVLHASAVQFSNYEQAVVVSGDGDFYCLYDYLETHRKLKAIIIPNKKSESSLLRRFQKYKVFLEDSRNKLKLKSLENKNEGRYS